MGIPKRKLHFHVGRGATCVFVYIDLNDWWVGYYRGKHKGFVCIIPTVVICWARG